MYKIVYISNERIVETLFYYTKNEVQNFYNNNRLAFLFAIDRDNHKIIAQKA